MQRSGRGLFKLSSGIFLPFLAGLKRRAGASTLSQLNQFINNSVFYIF